SLTILAGKPVNSTAVEVGVTLAEPMRDLTSNGLLQFLLQGLRDTDPRCFKDIRRAFPGEHIGINHHDDIVIVELIRQHVKFVHLWVTNPAHKLTAEDLMLRADPSGVGGHRLPRTPLNRRRLAVPMLEQKIQPILRANHTWSCHLADRVLMSLLRSMKSTTVSSPPTSAAMNRKASSMNRQPSCASCLGPVEGRITARQHPIFTTRFISATALNGFWQCSSICPETTRSKC